MTKKEFLAMSQPHGLYVSDFDETPRKIIGIHGDYCHVDYNEIGYEEMFLNDAEPIIRHQSDLTKPIICPLQFDIVDRLINRFSNKGDLVFDPFGGLGTTPYRALLMGRRGMSTELNPESFRDSLFYLRKAENDMNAPTLFDLEEIA